MPYGDNYSGSFGHWRMGARKSKAAKAGAILGVSSIFFNALLFTVPLGVLLAIVSFVCSMFAWRRHRLGQGGLWACAVSMLILLVWVFSFAVPMLADPTLTM